MSTRPSAGWSWVSPYLFVMLLVLFLGGVLGNLSQVKQAGVGDLGLTGTQAVRLLSTGLSLLLLWRLAHQASDQLIDNGRGASFLRAILRPLATFLVLVVGNKVLHANAAPLLDQFGQARYQWGFVGGLGATASWVTIQWIRHLDGLTRYLNGPDRASATTALRTQALDEVEPEDGTTALPNQTPVRADSTMPLRNGGTPNMLGRYKILKELGRGAMGIVYLGKDPTIQRFVAIKTVRLDEGDGPDRLQDVKARFFREAESTGRLSHPNIVTIYDAGEQHNLGYIAMEFLEGTTLREWCWNSRLLPERQVVETVITVAEALDYAHAQGVVHRDIKPANIMLTKDGRVKVMDFGIARLTTSLRTRTTSILGTPHYMSPEQIAGKTVDGRTDIFSLGVVLFELLTGKKPFDADNVSALLYTIVHDPHPELSHLRSDVHPYLETIVDQALQKELPCRYRKASELAQELRTCLLELAA